MADENNTITDIDLVKDESSEVVKRREEFEKQLQVQTIWGYGVEGVEAKKAAMAMLSTKNGMYARIPIICKADECPYSESCKLLSWNLTPLGEPCPIETSEIEIRFAEYCKDFDYDKTSFTDKNLMSEIISCDLMLERCKSLIAKEQVPVVDVVAGVSERGEEFTQPQVSKYWEAYERISKKRNTDFQLMMATRRDKKDQDNADKAKNISEILAQVDQEDMETKRNEKKG